MPLARFALTCAAVSIAGAAGCTLPALSCERDVDCPPGFACRAEACAVRTFADAGSSGSDAGFIEVDAGDVDVDVDVDVDAGSGDLDAGPGDDAGVAAVDDAGAGDWWDLAWQRRVRISIAGGGEALADFPLLISLDAAALDLAGAAADGRDVRFVDADGVTALAHEIESWKSDGVSNVWVRVPLIDAAGDAITMYFANDEAPDAQDSAGVWSAGYVGVWHLAGDPAVAVDDATASNADGSALNLSTGDRVAGVVAGALAFSGASAVRIDGSAQGPLNVLGPLTLSAWVRPDGAGGTVIARREGGTSQWQLQLEPITSALPQPSLIWTDAFGGQCVWSSDEGLTPGVWRHVAVAMDAAGAPVAFALDGVAVTFGQRAFCAGLPLASSIDVAIGARWAGVPNTGFGLAGAIDEARVETEVRSTAWMTAQHRSMTNTLVTLGVVEAP